EALPIPDPLAELAERKTGADGVAAFETFGPEDIGSFDVIAEGFGVQPRWIDPNDPRPKQVVLKPVAVLKGRLVPEGGDPKLVEGWRVRAWTREMQADPVMNNLSGYGSATADAEGRFVLPALAPGSLSLAVIPPGDSDLLPVLAG